MKALIAAITAAALGSVLGYGLASYSSGRTTGFDVLAPLYAAETDPWLEPLEGEQQPKLVIDDDNFDLGILPLDATVSHEFVISNQGDAPLRLRADQIIYEEYEFKLEKNELAPNESTTLRIWWTPRSSDAQGTWTPMDSAGPFTQLISVSSNDPEVPRKLLAVQGIHVPPAAIEKSEFALGLCDPDAEQKLETLVYVYHTDNLQLQTPQMMNGSLAEFFSVATEPLSAEELQQLPGEFGLRPKSGFRVSVTLKAGLPMGEFQQRIVLPFIPRSKLEVGIDVTGAVKSDMRLGGRNWHSRLKVLDFSGVQAQDGATAEMAVFVTGEFRDKFNLRFTGAEPSFLTVNIYEPTETADGQTAIYVIQGVVPPNSPPVELAGPLEGSEYGILRFETDHPRLRTFEIAVRLTVYQ